MKTPAHFYAHACRATDRWFVCQYGRDDNVAEAFAHEGRTAQYNAHLLAAALNALPLAANLAGLNTSRGAEFPWPADTGGDNDTEPNFHAIQCRLTDLTVIEED